MEILLLFLCFVKKKVPNPKGPVKENRLRKEPVLWKTDLTLLGKSGFTWSSTPFSACVPPKDFEIFSQLRMYPPVFWVLSKLFLLLSLPFDGCVNIVS